MNRDRKWSSSLSTRFLFSLCLCMCVPAEAYDVLVALQNGCCASGVDEESGPLMVCAEILFINGTTLTVENYTVNVSTTDDAIVTSYGNIAAQSGVDYFLMPTELTFPVDSQRGDIVCTDVEIIDDEAVENYETFYIELSTDDPNVQLLSYCQHKEYTIYDNDVITIMGLTTNVSENNGSVQACVNITEGSVESRDNFVYAVISTSASTGINSATAVQEFEVANHTLTFQNGDTVGVVRCITLSITDDTQVENDEHFNFSLTNGRRTQFNESSIEIYIIEDDVAEIGMVSSTLMTFEADTVISVCAVLINFVQLDIPLTAFVQTQAITATDNFDYAGELDAPIDFLHGDFPGISRCTNIAIMEDEIVENSEVFNAFLKENSSRLEINSIRNITQITIMEDNDFVNIGFQSLEFVTEESTSTRARVCAQIDTGSLERDVTAFLSTTATGNATENTDYVPVVSQGLTFTAGQSSIASSMSTQCGELVVLNDAVLEGNETISIRLTGESPHVIITTGMAEAQVILQEDANDFVVIGFPLGATLNATEGMDTTVNVCPQLLQGILERQVSVFATTFDMSARASTDYTSVINREITFSAGDSMPCIQVTIADDRNILEEIMETFRVTLTATEPFVTIWSQQESILIDIIEDPLDEITVGLQQTSYFALETGGPVSICAEMFDGTLERNVSLLLTSMDGNATAPNDYVALNTMLVFTLGQTAGDMACASLVIVDDTAIERDGEDITLSLSPVEPAVTVVTASSATVAITENNNDVVGSIVLNSSNYDAFEADGTVSVCAVIMAEALERTIVVQLSSQDSTATNTEDYIAFQLVPLTFDEGSSSGDERCYDVMIVDDNLVEDNEIFFVTLTSPEQTLLGGDLSRATVTINPDPADAIEFGFQQTNYSVSEQAGLRDVSVCVVVNNGTLERGIEIRFNTTDITAENSRDFVGPFPMSLSFSRGQTVDAQQCTTVFVLDDTLIEDDEIFNISLATSSVDANIVTFTPESSVATITIVQDPNDRAVIRLLDPTTNNTFGEGETVNVCAELVNNGGGLRRSISLSILLLSGTATHGRDFSGPSPATLTFASGSTPGNLQCISISLMYDNDAEATENFIVELRSNDSAVMVPAGGDIVIVNITDMPNPFVVEVSFLPRTYSGTEGVGSPAVEVCLQIVTGTIDKSGSAAAVNVSTVSQTAIAGRDFVFVNTSLTFFPEDTVGSPVRCVSITILNDEVVEAAETFDVVVSSNSILQINGTTSITVTINEDPTDFVTVGLQPLTSNPQERDTFFVCAEITSGSLERNVVVGLEAENNTAIQGVDFIGPEPSMLTFISGQSTGDIQCADVTILDNSILEGERSFSVQLAEVPSEMKVKVSDTMMSVDINIEDDPNDRVTVAFSQTIFMASEGDAYVLVCAELLTGDLETEISLLVDVLDLETNTATNGSDYTGLPEVILFSVGHPLNTPLCANVTIIDDDTLENVETFTVALYTDFPEGVFLTRDRSIVEIIDNEEGFTIGFSELLSMVGEGDGSVQVCTELMSGEIPVELGMVSLAVMANLANSSAIADQDYAGLPTTFSFVTGQSLSCILIDIIDDNIEERKETLSLILQPLDSSPGVRISRGQSIVEITDNDVDTGLNVGGGGSVSPGVSAALAIIVIVAVALAVALVFTVVALVLRRRKQKRKDSARQLLLSRDDDTKRRKLVNSPDKTKKRGIPLTMIDSKDHTERLVFSQDVHTEETKLANLPDKTKKSDISVTMIYGEDSAKQLVLNQDNDTEEIKLANSPDKTKKSDISVTMIYGEDSAKQLVLNQDNDTEETKLVNSSDKTKKSDIPLTMTDGKDSARQLVVNQDVNTNETKLVNSPDKAKKSDIPLTMSDHSGASAGQLVLNQDVDTQDTANLVDSPDETKKSDIPLTMIDSEDSAGQLAGNQDVDTGDTKVVNSPDKTDIPLTMTDSKDSARQLAVVDTEGEKLVDSPDRTKKSDIPLTMNDSKDSAGPVVVDNEETKPVDSPAKTKKGTKGSVRQLALNLEVEAKETKPVDSRDKTRKVGKGSVRQLALNLEVEAEEKKLVKPPAKTKKSDIPLTMRDSKDSAGQVVVDTDETKVVNSPAKTEKVGKGSVRQLALNLEVEPEKTKLVNSPAKTKKIGKSSVRQLALSLEVEAEEKKLVNPPAKSDIPLTTTDSKDSAGQLVVGTDEIKVENSPAKTKVGKPSVRQLALNLEVEPKETKLVNSPAKAKKSKGSVRQFVLNLEAETGETKPVNSRDKTKKSDIPLTVIDS